MDAISMSACPTFTGSRWQLGKTSCGTPDVKDLYRQRLPRTHQIIPVQRIFHRDHVPNNYDKYILFATHDLFFETYPSGSGVM